MPLKIRNIVTLDIKQINRKELNNFPKNIWQVVSQKEIYRIYEASINDHRDIIERGEYEKIDLENALLNHPNAQFDKLPDSENWDRTITTEDTKSIQSLDRIFETGHLLPINTPKKNIININPAKNKPVISKILKNDYIKYTIIGVIVYIIGYFLYEYFKYRKW